MDFQAPEPADLANVRSLNLSFLEFLGGRGRDLPAFGELPEDLLGAICRLDREQCERLARSPFLVFSLREADERCWSAAFEGRFRPDLIDGIDPPSIEQVRLVTATLGFLWQYSRRRPYAARVVSGASPSWCENLAASTLVDLFGFATRHNELLTFRMVGNVPFWRKLLLAATSNERPVRIAARLSALQTVLTSPVPEARQRLPAAACSLPMVVRRVSEHGDVSKQRSRAYNTRPDESTVHKKPHQNLRER